MKHLKIFEFQSGINNDDVMTIYRFSVESGGGGRSEFDDMHFTTLEKAKDYAELIFKKAKRGIRTNDTHIEWENENFKGEERYYKNYGTSIFYISPIEVY